MKLATISLLGSPLMIETYAYVSLDIRHYRTDLKDYE